MKKRPYHFVDEPNGVSIFVDVKGMEGIATCGRNHKEARHNLICALISYAKSLRQLIDKGDTNVDG